MLWMLNTSAPSGNHRCNPSRAGNAEADEPLIGLTIKVRCLEAFGLLIYPQ